MVAVPVTTSSFEFEAQEGRAGEEWDEFLRSTPGNHHLQSTGWAAVKSSPAGGGWRARRLILRRGGGIIGGVQVLYRDTRRLGRVGYAPRGPVLAEPSRDDAMVFLSEFERSMRESGYTYVMMQPPAVSAHVVPCMRARGFHETLFEIAPTATILIDLRKAPEEWLTDMRSSTRRAVRTGLKSGLTVRQGNADDLPAFHSLLRTTGRRQGFDPPGLEYFRELWTQFGCNGELVLFLAENDGVAVAAELDLAFGDTLVSKRAGWSGEHAKARPNELLVWTALNWAKRQGLRYYDLEGLNRDLADAIVAGQRDARADATRHHSFKLGFGGEIALLPHNMDYVYGPVSGWVHRNVWVRLPIRWRHKAKRRLLRM